MTESVKLFSDLALNISGSIISAIIIILYSRKNLAEKLNKLTNAKKTCEDISNNLAGARITLAEAGRSFSSDILNEDILRVNLNAKFLKFIQDIETSVDSGTSKLDNLIGSLNTIERAGDDLK